MNKAYIVLLFLIFLCFVSGCVEHQRDRYVYGYPQRHTYHDYERRHHRPEVIVVRPDPRPRVVVEPHHRRDHRPDMIIVKERDRHNDGRDYRHDKGDKKMESDERKHRSEGGKKHDQDEDRSDKKKELLKKLKTRSFAGKQIQDE